MKRITLSFPDTLYDKIAAAAAANTRSFSGEVMHRLAPAATFPDPPKGKKWHNPEGLTPEQVGVADGWRLCLTTERAIIKHQHHVKSKWFASDIADCKFAGLTRTYRTKAFLPK